MPRTRECDFCGADIEPGTGTMLVLNDGTTHHFCSTKCEKNHDLGREPRDVEWTAEGQARGGPTGAAGDVAPEEAEAEEATAAAETETETDAVETDADESPDGDEAEAAADDDGRSEATADATADDDVDVDADANEEAEAETDDGAADATEDDEA